MPAWPMHLGKRSFVIITTMLKSSNLMILTSNETALNALKGRREWVEAYCLLVRSSPFCLGFVARICNKKLNTLFIHPCQATTRAMLCGPQAEGICGGCHAGLLSPIEAHFIQRQLKLYGSKGPDGGGYHELFLRHKLFLCGTMVRYCLL